VARVDAADRPRLRYARHARPSAAMNHLYLAPRFEVSADGLHGCTPWPVRLLSLFSFCRCVTVSRRLNHVIIATRWLWLWHRSRLIRFDQVSRIIYRAQAIPSLNFWRYLSLDDSAMSDSALFMISLSLKHSEEELPLFTVWEEQPTGESDWLDELAGDRAQTPEVGDEAAESVVETLQKFLRVRIAEE
jgi:hypothetical protein